MWLLLQFCLVAALETAYYRKNKKLVEFSEQQIVDCSKKYHQAGGCGGGWMHNVYKYLVDLYAGGSGLNTDTSYPYEAKVGECRHKTSDNAAPVAKYVRIPYGNEQALKDAVASCGPVAIAYDAGTPAFWSYQGGIYSSPQCTKHLLSHAVCIVGYGAENGQDFWIVKNSWGDTWGEKGYFRMARNMANMCGVASDASYPILA